MSNPIPDGTPVGPYRIVKMLGEGGMGRTYLAEQSGLKFVLKECVNDDPKDDIRSSLHDEAKFLARLTHPRLPSVKGLLAVNADQVFMVMEYISGTTLEGHMEALPKPPGWNQTEAHLKQVLDWSLQLTETLDFLHKIRPDPILHRDIKGKNIMVRPDGRVALIDFGIARYFKANKAVKKERDTIVGFTAGWAAPEYVHFKRSTPQCDIYSLGVVMYYLLCGAGPDEENGDDIQHLPKLQPIGNKLWDKLVEIMERARHVAPEERYPSATEMARDLGRLGTDRSETECAVCGRFLHGTFTFCRFCGAAVRTAAEVGTSPSATKVAIARGPNHQRLREDILRAIALKRPAHLERFNLCQQIEEMEHDPGFGELVSLDNLPKVMKLPYQIEAVQKALQQMGGYCLLADEVGLGKTVEAAIILKEVMLRGAKRILIITPPKMCTQWQQELFEKFDEYFLVFGRDVDTTLAWKCDRVIAPYNVAEDRTHRLAVMAQKYDLVIMDEAHHLIVTDPHRGWQLHQFARQLGRNTRYFLMLSATPLHNNLRELHTLLTLLKPGSVDDYARFEQRYVDKKDPLRPRNVEELRKKLESVMIRNTRRKIQYLRFPRREAYSVEVPVAPPQAKVLRAFREFVRKELWRMADQLSTRDAGMNMAFRSALQELVESFHSSAQAFQTNCESFLERFRSILKSRGGVIVSDRLQEFKRTMPRDLVRAKIDEVCKILRRRAPFGGKFLVFSQYEDTAEELYAHVAAETNLPTVLFPIGDTLDSTDQTLEVMNRFHADARVMVCGPNAAEGLNLQAAHSMINFDLPWDPMQLEQRIGRIQRLGGAPKVFIWNLYLKGTIEEDILSILDSKIQMFGETIGEVEQIIGGLDKGDSFDNQMLDLYLADPESEVELKELEKQRNELFSPGRRQTSTAAKLLGGVFTDQEVTATTGDQRETTRPRATDPPSDDLQRLGTSSSPSMRCVACNEPIDPDAECCTNCGEEQTPAELDFEQLQARSLESSVSPTADDSVPMTACPHCQRLQPMDRSACENCGQKLDTPLEKTTDDSDAWDDATNPPGNGFHCVHCGASVDAGAECCTECGEPLA